MLASEALDCPGPSPQQQPVGAEPSRHIAARRRARCSPIGQDVTRVRIAQPAQPPQIDLDKKDVIW